jgi:hypothetical protein
MELAAVIHEFLDGQVGSHGSAQRLHTGISDAGAIQAAE